VTPNEILLPTESNAAGVLILREFKPKIESTQCCTPDLWGMS